MIIETIEESIERCTESGWYAYDILLQEPISREVILQIKELGNFVYLQNLKQPFYKIETEEFIIKGIEGRKQLRFAVYKERESKLLEMIKEYIKKI